MNRVLADRESAGVLYGAVHLHSDSYCTPIQYPYILIHRCSSQFAANPPQVVGTMVGTGKQRMLRVAQLKSFNAPGTYGDGNGLYLQVSPKGKSWIFRYQRHGRRREMGLGSLADVGLADARRKAQDARQALAEGVDPIQARQASRAAQRLAEAQAVTFRDMAEEFVADNRAGWRNPKHRAQWSSTLKTYVYPALGKLPVQAIDTDLVLKVLKPIWHTKPETASRVRGRIERVLSAAKTRGLRNGENPAQWRGHLDTLLQPRSKVRKVRHQPALPYRDVPQLMRELAELDSISARALRFTILTAARTNETIGARWPEFNLADKLWKVPASRMKADKAHEAPLSDAALAIVEKMAETRISAFVFPGWRDRQPLSDMAMLEVLRGVRPGFTVHGFRSSFKDWANEQTSFPDFLSEMALAHVEGNKTRKAYARAELMTKRRQLMAEWGDFCCQQGCG